MRRCEDCGAKIGIRATRCPPCRRAYRTQYENDRAARVRQAAQEARARDDVVEDEVGLEVVDYCAPGAASKPPSFSGVPPKPQPVRVVEVIGDGRVRHPAERVPRRDLTGIPATTRMDRARLDAELRRQEIGYDSEMASWDELQSARHDNGRTVSFHVPALPPPGARQAPRVNALGQSIPRARWS